MSHPAANKYKAFTVGGIIPDKYAHRFTTAHQALRGRVENVDMLLIHLWTEAMLEERDVQKAWLTFTFLMAEKVKELDEGSNGTLL
jgi:hypothetical protein